MGHHLLYVFLTQVGRLISLVFTKILVKDTSPKGLTASLFHAHLAEIDACFDFAKG